MLGDLKIIGLDSDGKMRPVATLDNVRVVYEDHLAIAYNGNDVVASMQTFTDDAITVHDKKININVGIPLNGPGIEKEYCEWEFAIRKV